MLSRRLFHTLQGKWLDTPVNFTEEAAKMIPEGDGPNPALDPLWCEQAIGMWHQMNGVDYTFGGYMEDRETLWRGHYHKTGCVIHVGVDYNVPVYTPVFLPRPGKLVLMEDYPDQYGGWGCRAIYQIGDLWVTFGHLINLNGKVGLEYEEKHIIGQVGPADQNGGWYPHLHVHCQKDYEPWRDAYLPMCGGLREAFPNPEEVL
jgi:hypothetical protein